MSFEATSFKAVSTGTWYQYLLFYLSSGGRHTLTRHTVREYNNTVRTRSTAAVKETTMVMMMKKIDGGAILKVYFENTGTCTVFEITTG